MSESHVALVTGATSGIGRATALAYGKAGYRVALAGRRADRGEALANEIKSAGGEAAFFQTDVSDPAQLRGLVESTVGRYGRLDIAFNNAGIEGDVFVPLHEQKPENYAQVFDVNVRAVLEAMQAEIPAMLEDRRGGDRQQRHRSPGSIGFSGHERLHRQQARGRPD